MRDLRVQNNLLSGELPPELGNMVNVRELRLQNNVFTGAIPGEFGALSELTRFEVQENLLTGEIPASLTNLTKVRRNNLNLAQNCLSASDPNVIEFLAIVDPGWDTEQMEDCSAKPSEEESA
jgi:hypothetical protein